MKLYEFPCGDELHFYKKSLVLSFSGTRKVFSTGLNHGGCRTDLQAVFNNDGNPGPGMEFVLRAPDYRQHLDIIAKEDLGLDPEKCTGFCTAASMDNVSIQSMEREFFTVTAIVTGGIEGNGARIGDPACYSETPGTINMMVHIDACLPDGTLAKAAISCGEAKVAAIQELMAASRYSRGLATGSGTDGIIVVCNPESQRVLTDAGHHSELGECIGQIVKRAVKEALFRQTGLCAEKQHDLIRRMDRFGVTSDSLWKLYEERMNKETPGDCMLRLEFENCLDHIKKEDRAVTFTSLYAHLLDQLAWELLSVGEVCRAAQDILKLAELDSPYDGDWTATAEKADDPVDWLVGRYMEALLDKIQRTASCGSCGSKQRRNPGKKRNHEKD